MNDCDETLPAVYPIMTATSAEGMGGSNEEIDSLRVYIPFLSVTHCSTLVVTPAHHGHQFEEASPQRFLSTGTHRSHFSSTRFTV